MYRTTTMRCQDRVLVTIHAPNGTMDSFFIPPQAIDSVIISLDAYKARQGTDGHLAEHARLAGEVS